MVELATLTDGTQHYRMTVELDGADYTFDFNYNSRVPGWTFDLYDVDMALLVASVRVSTKCDLLKAYVKTGLPAGILMAVDLLEQDGDATAINLGTRIILVYFEDADVA